MFLSILKIITKIENNQTNWPQVDGVFKDLHKEVEDSNGYDNSKKYWCGNADGYDGGDNSECTAEPGAQSYGDDLINCVHVLHRDSQPIRRQNHVRGLTYFTRIATLQEEKSCYRKNKTCRSISGTFNTTLEKRLTMRPMGVVSKKD